MKFHVVWSLWTSWSALRLSNRPMECVKTRKNDV